ncbi:MAG: hypothetical protein WBA62_22660 [Xanthobacteraceae bacterium]|jgi:hypothetical protein
MAYSDRLMCEGDASRVGATIPRNLMGFLDAFKAAHVARELARRN